MSFHSVSQFYRENYDLMLRIVDKEYSLWKNDKREWWQDKDGVWITRAKQINRDFQPDLGYSLDVKHSIDPVVFAHLNQPAPHTSHQVLGSEVEILIDKTDVVISLTARSKELDLLYFAIMAKLHIPAIKPIFLKILYKTIEGTYYTLAPFLYSPHLHFTHSLTSFKNFI